MSNSYQDLLSETQLIVKGIAVPPWYTALAHDFDWNCIQEQWQFNELMDQNNWRVARPGIRVQATRNQLGNLQVNWGLAITQSDIKSIEELEFSHHLASKVAFHTEAYGNRRPQGELFWVRTPVCSGAGNHVMAAAALLHRGLVTRYNEIIRKLREAFEFGEVPDLIARYKKSHQHASLSWEKNQAAAPPSTS